MFLDVAGIIAFVEITCWRLASCAWWHQCCRKCHVGYSFRYYVSSDHRFRGLACLRLALYLVSRTGSQSIAFNVHLSFVSVVKRYAHFVVALFVHGHPLVQSQCLCLFFDLVCASSNPICPWFQGVVIIGWHVLTRSVTVGVMCVNVVFAIIASVVVEIGRRWLWLQFRHVVGTIV